MEPTQPPTTPTSPTTTEESAAMPPESPTTMAATVLHHVLALAAATSQTLADLHARVEEGVRVWIAFLARELEHGLQQVGLRPALPEGAGDGNDAEEITVCVVDSASAAVTEPQPRGNQFGPAAQHAEAHLSLLAASAATSSSAATPPAAIGIQMTVDEETADLGDISAAIGTAITDYVDLHHRGDRAHAVMLHQVVRELVELGFDVAGMSQPVGVFIERLDATFSRRQRDVEDTAKVFLRVHGGRER